MPPRSGQVVVELRPVHAAELLPLGCHYAVAVLLGMEAPTVASGALAGQGNLREARRELDPAGHAADHAARPADARKAALLELAPPLLEIGHVLHDLARATKEAVGRHERGALAEARHDLELVQRCELPVAEQIHVGAHLHDELVLLALMGVRALLLAPPLHVEPAAIAAVRRGGVATVLLGEPRGHNVVKERNVVLVRSVRVNEHVALVGEMVDRMHHLGPGPIAPIQATSSVPVRDRLDPLLGQHGWRQPNVSCDDDSNIRTACCAHYRRASRTAQRCGARSD
eukprot:scaffold42705_cov54-Phaeocystis_antarctica.AAC.4